MPTDIAITSAENSDTRVGADEDSSLATEFKWGLSVNKWSDIKCSDMEWTDVIYVKWFYFEVKWTEVSYGEVIGDKSAMYIRVTLYLIILWLFHLGVSCTVS
jgi:hypothetical protein